MKYLLFLFFFSFINPTFAEINFPKTNIQSSRCESDLSKITKFFDKLAAENYEIAFTIDLDELKKQAFVLKMSLRDQLKSFYRNKNLSENCANAFRETFRAIRTFEDIVEERQVRLDPTRVSPSAFFPNEQTMTNLDYSNFNINTDLESGDILLTRGNAFTSAAIASLGEFDTQFSHMSLVYKNESSGKIYTIESHIEIGVVAKELQVHIDQNNMRMVVFRPKGNLKKIAHKAAFSMYKKAKLASSTRGNIPYDFAMDMEDLNELFCSEVISLAFDLVATTPQNIPMFPSALQKRKSSFVKGLGITVDKSFVPADIEIDPRFDLILEWRDGNRINDSMNKDAVLHAIYEKYEQGYTLRPTVGMNSFVYRYIAYPLRRIPGLNKKIIERFPLNMSRSLLGMFAVLDDVGEILQKELDVKNNQAIAKRGIPLLRSEKRVILLKILEHEDRLRNSKLRKRFNKTKS